MKSSSNTMIRTIAVFKLLKAILFIVIAVSAVRLLHQDVGATLERWATMLGLDPGNQYVDKALAKLADLSPNKIRGLGIVAFAYAGLFLTEGIGLWREKRWAEWFTIIVTSSLVPLEIYDIHRHPTPLNILALIINLAVVGYLVHRIRTPARA